MKNVFEDETVRSAKKNTLKIENHYTVCDIQNVLKREAETIKGAIFY